MDCSININELEVLGSISIMGKFAYEFFVLSTIIWCELNDVVGKRNFLWLFIGIKTSKPIWQKTKSTTAKFLFTNRYFENQY